MKTTTTARKVNWIPLPDPITEDEVKLELTRSAEVRPPSNRTPVCIDSD